MKTCTKCKESKELEDFPINLRMKTGRGSWCRKCGAASNREWQKLTGYKSKPLDDDIDLLLQAIKYLKEAKHGKQAA